eukprot:10178920-Alexandrium_andersonii.AAC.1
MVDTGFRCPPEKLHRLADCYAEKPRRAWRVAEPGGAQRTARSFRRYGSNSPRGQSRVGGANAQLDEAVVEASPGDRT